MTGNAFFKKGRCGYIFCIAILMCTQYLNAQHSHQIFWRLSQTGGTIWDLATEQRLPHHDNIEMSGAKVSAIIYYEINKNKQLEIKREVIFPQLRTFDKNNGVS